jgi:hypothetical protein
VRRPLTFLISGLFAFAALTAGWLTTPSPAAAATAAPTTTCSNSVDNTGGLGLICEVTIVNTITASGGSAKVTIRECHGAAGAPTASCTNNTTNLTKPVTTVNQCNGSINGGGGTLRCSVVVTQTFNGVKPGRSTATVNQCVGSGGGITVGCDPFPANTTGATITQCNGSANGGTLVGLTCTATGTKSSTHGVRINQCNGSANGGGALVICSASVVNRIGTAPSSSSGSSAAPTAPTTSIAAAVVARPTESSAVIVLGLAFLVASSLFVAYRRYRAMVVQRRS